jgi:hypothetical protein
VLTFHALSIFAFACLDIGRVSGYSETEERFVLKRRAPVRYTSFFLGVKGVFNPGDLFRIRDHR